MSLDHSTTASGEKTIPTVASAPTGSRMKSWADLGRSFSLATACASILLSSLTDLT